MGCASFTTTNSVSQVNVVQVAEFVGDDASKVFRADNLQVLEIASTVSDCSGGKTCDEIEELGGIDELVLKFFDGM